MKLPRPWRTLSGKLVLAALVVEAVMLSLLIGTSLNLLYSTFSDEAERHAAQFVPVLQAALVAPLTQRDQATIDAILQESAGLESISYLAVADREGKTIAISGWPIEKPLPLPDASISLTPKDGRARYDLVAPLSYAGQVLGTLHLGLDLSPIVLARQTLLRQGGFIALSEILLTALLLGLVGTWLSRKLRHLSAASDALGQGKFVRLPASTSDDDVGRVISAFNAMSRSLEARTEALIESEARFRDLFHHHSAPFVLIDKHGQFRDLNAAAHDFYGYPDGELPGSPLDRIVVASRESLAADRDLVLTGASRVLRQTHRRCDGQLLEVEVLAAPITQGEHTLIFAIVHDITARLAAEEKLRLMASVFEHAQEGIMVTDPAGQIIEVNQAFSTITGYARDEAIDQTPAILRSGRHDAEFYETMWGSIETGGCWQGEIVNRRKNGEIYPELLTISGVPDEQGKPLRYISLFSDISMLKTQQEKLEQLAHYDSLTGLPNRTLLADRLQMALAQARRSGREVGVALLDLDGFKPINDQHGHSTGDLILVEVATRLRQAVRETDTVARLGGDEFVLVLTGVTSRKEVELMLNRVLDALADPYPIGEDTVQLSASIGLTLYPDDEADADTLLRHADQAMYAAKQAGRNRWHAFDAVLDRNQEARLATRTQIEAALAHGELVLFYQPKVDLARGVVIGAEALIRWQHPQRGLVPPGDFLPIIEDTDFEVTLSEWVMRTALAQVSAWRESGLALPVSVNLPARHLQSEAFLPFVERLLAGYPELPPGHFELEVLETAALGDLLAVSQKMKACTALGVSFALDDFGTGYASLAYLKRLPTQIIKIDQGFVADMLIDANDLAIVEAVIALAAAFSNEVIAEGVETVAHGVRLLHLGCELAQGYGIARPMPAHEIPNWAAAWRPDPAFAHVLTPAAAEARPAPLAI